MIKNPYNLIRGTAKAIFNIANKSIQTKEYLILLEHLKDLIKLKKINIIIKNNLYSPTAKASLLIELLNTLVKSSYMYSVDNQKSIFVDDLFSNFIKILAKKNILLCIPKIFLAYQYMYLRHVNYLKVELTTAVSLEHAQQTYFKQLLLKYFNKNLLLSYNIDPGIIAGLVLKYNDKVIDYSVKTKLQQMKALLQKSN